MGDVLLTESAKRFCDSSDERSRKRFSEAFRALTRDPYPPDAKRLARSEGQFVYRSAGVRLVYLVQDGGQVVVMTAAIEADTSETEA